MSVRDCISKLAAVPGVKDAVMASARKIEAKAEKLKNIYERKGIPNFEQKADEDAVRFFKEDIEATQRKLVIQQEVQARNVENLSKVEQGPVYGLERLIQKTDDDSQILFGLATQKLEPLFEKLRSKIPSGIDNLFRSNKRYAQDLYKALDGNTRVAKELQEFAVEIKKAREYLVETLKSAGIKVKALKDYDYSYSRGRDKILSVSRDEYANDMIKLLDEDNMYHLDGTPMSTDEILQILKNEHDTLKTQVINGQRGILGGSLNAESDSARIYSFKNSDAFLKAFDKYGEGELASNLFEGLQSLARDASLAKNLGPNYKKGFKVLRDPAVGSLPKGAMSTIKKNLLDQEFKVLSGAPEGVANEFAAAAGAGLRNIFGAANLVMSGITSLADNATMRATANQWGITYNKVFGKVLKSYLVPGQSKKNREFIARTAGNLGPILQSRSIGSRFADIGSYGSFARATGYLADFTMRAGGAVKATLDHKFSLWTEFHNGLYDLRVTGFDQLDNSAKGLLQLYNVDAKTWDNWRAAATSETRPDGSQWDFIDPNKLNQEDAVKLGQMLTDQVRRGVPEPDVKTRAIMTGGARAGSVERELRGLTFQFMAYPITSALKTLDTLMHDPRNVGTLNKVGYAANTLIGTTMIAALVMNLKDVARGKDLRDPNDPMFWLEAMTFNNFAGSQFIAGAANFALGGEGRASGFSATGSIVPPAFGILFDAGATGKNIATAIKEGNYEGIQKEALLFLQDHFPVDTPITALPFQRYVKDTILKYADPKAASKYYRRAKKLQERTGQGYWWDFDGNIRAPRFGDKPE